MAAFDAAGDPGRFPDAGPAWQPLKLYYNQTFSRARIEAFHEALTALGEESPYAEWLEGWNRPDRVVTTRVAVRRLVRPPRRRAARPRDAGRPRRQLGSRSRARCRPGSGPSRSTRPPRPTSRSPRARTTSSPACPPTSRRPTRWPPRRPHPGPRHPHGACRMNDSPPDVSTGFLAFLAFALLGARAVVPHAEHERADAPDVVPPAARPPRQERPAGRPRRGGRRGPRRRTATAPAGHDGGERPTPVAVDGGGD